SVVLRGGRWRNGLALVEIGARRFRDGGRGGEIDDRFRALFWGNRKALGEPCEARNQAAALIADAGGGEAGMEAIGGNSRSLQLASQVAGEKNVAKLGATIGFHGSKTLCQL